LHSGPAIRGYHFAGFTLDVPRRRLVGPGQVTIALSGRAFEVLAMLLDHRDRLVTKRELLDGVWPHMVVEENNLTQAISTLRRVLGDSRESPRFIATVAGRGYQFIGDVRVETDTAVITLEPARVPTPVTTAAPTPLTTAAAAPVGASTPARVNRRQLVMAAGIGVAAVAAGAGWWLLRGDDSARLPSTIAVLPFRPLLSSARNEAIEIGVAELLINRLSMLPGLVVRPLSSVRRYSSIEQDPFAAGRELGVEAVVEGYVQVEQDDVRVTVRLLDVATGQSLWAGNYTERLGNFFAVQDSLVTQLVSALPVDLPEQARRQLVAYSTKDSEAWQLYAHGRYQVDRRDQDSIRRAREYFEAAVARDPNFALAIAGLSEAWALSSIFNLATPRDGFNRARAAAQRALAIDPQLAPALVSLGHVRTQLDHAWEDARRLYRQAMARDPKSELPHTFMGLNKTQSGSVTEALDHLARAQALEPASIVTSTASTKNRAGNSRACSNPCRRPDSRASSSRARC
jgi:DNA-binding winged helix-turn-helix (wHTH) protein/TolB-like protein